MCSYCVCFGPENTAEPNKPSDNTKIEKKNMESICIFAWKRGIVISGIGQRSLGLYKGWRYRFFLHKFILFTKLLCSIWFILFQLLCCIYLPRPLKTTDTNKKNITCSMTMVNDKPHTIQFFTFIPWIEIIRCDNGKQRLDCIYLVCVGGIFVSLSQIESISYGKLTESKIAERIHNRKAKKFTWFEAICNVAKHTHTHTTWVNLSWNANLNRIAEGKLLSFLLFSCWTIATVTFSAFSRTKLASKKDDSHIVLNM